LTPRQTRPMRSSVRANPALERDNSVTVRSRFAASAHGVTIIFALANA
jgi:hypothetical protein